MILESTPYGTSIDEVRHVAQTLLDETCRFGLQESSMNRGPSSLSSVPTRYRISGCVGTGRDMVIFHAYTFVEWYFDDGGVLVRVEVIRGADAL